LGTPCPQVPFLLWDGYLAAVKPDRSDKNLLVMRASAGSGKTFALVKQYLLLCLGRPQPAYYRHILAITFTNAAAAEMKERIISRLREFSELKPAGFQSNALAVEICESLEIPAEELCRRSEAVLSHMLHHYDLLAVSTIDSFTHRIVRAFARELGLDRDFSVEMDTNGFLDEVVDRLLEQSGADLDLAEYLTAFVVARLEEGRDWRIKNEVRGFSEMILKEESIKHLAEIGNLKPGEIREAIATLRNVLREMKSTLSVFAGKILEVVDNAGIKDEELSGGAARNPMRRARSSWLNGDFEDPTDTMREMCVGSKSWLPKSAPVELKERVAEIEAALAETMSDAISYIDKTSREYTRMCMLVRGSYALGLAAALSKEADELRDERNIALISDFHRRINEVVNDSPTPFLYEKIGERFHHILFDEFQDTSALQWSNFIPLIENNLASGHLNFIVGDGKQAIYRWRNGKVEQFIQLPVLPEEAASSWRQQLFANSYQKAVLDVNRRSAKEIITFNNTLYRTIAPRLGKWRNVYDDLNQLPSRKEEGYVKVSVINEGKKKSERIEPILNEILKNIEECRKDNYRYSDIAILTRKGKGEGAIVAAWLHEQGIPVVTKETFRLSNSPLVRWVFSFLGYINEPTQPRFRAEIIITAREAFPHLPQPMPETFFVSNGRYLDYRTEDFLREFLPGIVHEVKACRSVREMIIALFQTAHVSHDVYTEFLLDQLTAAESKYGTGIHAVLEWWKARGDQLYIQSGDIGDAIQIMTIHKSKGLQFPVVIYPRFSSRARQQSVWVNPSGTIPQLTSALVTAMPSPGKPDYPFDELEEEAGQQILDDVNVCYVATTRPEDRLYFILEKPGPNAWESLFLNELNMGDQTECSFGLKEMRNNPLAEVKHEPPASPERFSRNTSWKIAAGQPLPDPDNPRWMGQLIHACLAAITNDQSARETVQRVASAEGIRKEITLNQLWSKVSDILQWPSFKSIFEEAEIVCTERDLILPDGRTIRPDRMIRRGKEWIVVDFKTGKPKPEHKTQVQRYMEVLKEIEEVNVRGWIAYTESGFVEVI